MPDGYEVVDLPALGNAGYEIVDEPGRSRFPAAGEVRQRARKNLARELPKVGQEQQERIVHEARTTEMVRAAEMLPFAVAAPFTGGSSLAVGTAVMAGAGLAGGVARELIQAGREGQTKKMGALAASLGMDAASGALGEVGLRGAGAFAKEGVALAREGLEASGAGQAALRTAEKGIGLGLTNVRKIMATVAQQSQKGAAALEEAIGVTRKALYAEVGDGGVNISKALKTARADLQSLPGGKGAWGRPQAALSGQAGDQLARIGASEAAETQARSLQSGISTQYTKMGREADKARRAGASKTELKGITDRGREIVKEMEDKLKMAQDQISSEQNIDAVIVQQRRISDVANNLKEPISPEERVTFKRLGNDLESAIQRHLETSGTAKASALFAQDKALSSVKQDRTVSEEMMRFTVGRIIRGVGYKAAGALTGGAVGYETGGGIAGAAKGAAIGAAASFAMEQGSIYALRRIVANPEAARLWGQALRLKSAGLNLRAAEMAEKAIRSVDGLPQALRVAHQEDRDEQAAYASRARPIGQPNPLQADFTPK